MTSNGVYHIADTRPGSGATWTNITSNMFQITHQIFGNSAYTDQLMANLHALAVDWRYVIPNDPDNPPTDNPTDPNRTHPVLYVAGEGGVLVSYDDGGSWQRFPSALPTGPNNTPTPPGDGGGFPTANVTDLDLALGNIQRTTGRPDLAGPYDPIEPGAAPTPTRSWRPPSVAAQYAIRLAPVTFPSTVQIDPRSVVGTAPDGTPLVSTSQPVFDGLSSITGFKNATRITIVDVTDPEQSQDHRRLRSHPTWRRTSRPTGRMPRAGSRSRSGPVCSPTEGLKKIEIYATDDAGCHRQQGDLSFTFSPQPPKTPTLQMSPADDTGIAGDNITIIAAAAFHRGDRSRRRGPFARRNRDRDRRARIQQPRRVV